MSDEQRPPSPRRAELLARAYDYVLSHGLAELSLRPLAAAIGSSPRVLLFLFESKDGLIRALLAHARADQLALLSGIRRELAGAERGTVVRAVWRWLSDPSHRPLLVLWLEAYGRSLSEPDGPWADFARQTVTDWLAILSGPATEPTLALAVLRGCLLDLLATGDADRTTAALEDFLASSSAR
ncbi:TetR/AcrR family transcriptional regulator [Plantactinospora siamensis]|uniref:TetR/AcrR family transcriptional regulator n=1 Tax=Plantactinospora siamensis TaxID=555372 RepID=A0ABV6P488_9ACTN